MESSSHPASACPSSHDEGQTAFYDVNDSAWVAMILRRLKAGDVVTVTRMGDFIITDGG